MPEPSLPAGEVAQLLGLSAERDLWLRFALDAWRRGYAAAAGDQYAAGYAAAVADIKNAEHAFYRHVARRAADLLGRWQVRGETRTRATFGQPHKDDYPGRAA